MSNLTLTNARRRMFKTVCDSPVFHYGIDTSASNATQIYNNMSVELTTSVYLFASCSTANATLTWIINVYNRQGTLTNTYNGTTQLSGVRKTSLGQSITIPNDNGYVIITGTCKTLSTEESIETVVCMYNSQINTDIMVSLNKYTSNFTETCSDYGYASAYADCPCEIHYTYTQSPYGSSTIPSDPTDPDISSPLYDEYIAFDRNTKIKVKAIATQPGYNDSDIVMGTFIMDYVEVNNPVVSLNSGTYYDEYKTCTIINRNINAFDNPYGQIRYVLEYLDSDVVESETLPTSTTDVTLEIKHACKLTASILYIKQVQETIGGTTYIGTPSHPLQETTYNYSTVRHYNILFRPQVQLSRIVSETGDSAMIECKVIYPKIQYLDFDEHEVNLKLKLEKGERVYNIDTTQDPYLYQMGNTYTYTDISSSSEYYANEITRYGNISPDLNQSVSSLYSAETSSSPAKYLSTIRVRIPRLSVNTHYRITPQLTVMYSRNGTLCDAVTPATSVTSIQFDTLPAYRGTYAIHPIHNNASSNSIVVKEMYYDSGWHLTNDMHTVVVNLAPINVSYCGLTSDSNYPSHIEASDWGFSDVVSKNGTNGSYNYSFLTEPWSFIGDVNLSDKNILDCISKTYDHRFANNSVSTNVRDLFGWGTSYNDNSAGSGSRSNPWNTSQIDSNYCAYGETNTDLRNVRSRAVQYTPTEPNTLAYDASNYENARIYADWASVRTAGTANNNNDGEYVFTAVNGSVSWYPWYNHYPIKQYQGSQINKSNCDISAYNGLTKYRSTQGSYSSNPSSTDWQTRTKMATLSEDEWNYILGLNNTGRKYDYSSSSSYSGTERMCYAKGRIHLNAGSGRPTDLGSRDYYGDSREYINGLFVFSDQFQTLSDKPFTFTNINTTNGTYAANTVSANEWYGYDTSSGGTTIHVSGLENWITFLPAAGYRLGTDRYESNEQGYYWTRTHGSTSSSAKCLHFSESIVEVVDMPKSRGCSVRLGKYEYYGNRSSSLVSVSMSVIEKTPQYIKIQCKVLNNGGFDISSIYVERWTTGHYQHHDTSDDVDYYEWIYHSEGETLLNSKVCDNDGICTFDNMDGLSTESGKNLYKCILYVSKTGSGDPDYIVGTTKEIAPLSGEPKYGETTLLSFDNNETNTTTDYAVGTFGSSIDRDMGFNITERGVFSSSKPSPEYNELVTTANGSGKGSFTTNVYFLKRPYAYTQYVRTYAKSYNTGGWGNEYYWHSWDYWKYGRPYGWSQSPYSDMLTINVSAVYPWIKDCNVSNQNNIYSDDYVTCEFDISSEVVLNAPSLNSVYPVTSRGFCWSTASQQPTINATGCYTVDCGSGSGTFSGHVIKNNISTHDYSDINFYVRPFTTVSSSLNVYTKYGDVVTVHFQITT